MTEDLDAPCMTCQHRYGIHSLGDAGPCIEDLCRCSHFLGGTMDPKNLSIETQKQTEALETIAKALSALHQDAVGIERAILLLAAMSSHSISISDTAAPELRRKLAVEDCGPTANPRALAKVQSAIEILRDAGLVLGGLDQ